jgi:acyl carrier protein
VTKDEIRAVVLRALGDIAPETDPASLASDESVREALDIDSMDFLRFVTVLHDALGVSVPEADYRKIDTIDGAVAYLADKHAGAHPEPRS